MAATVLAAPPIGAQEEAPPAPEVDVPAPEVEVPQVPLDEPPLEQNIDLPVQVRATNERVEDQVIPAQPVSTEADRPGWSPVIAAETAAPGRPSILEDTPVTLTLDSAEAPGTAVSAVVNVLTEDLSNQLSPFDAAVSMTFADSNGRHVEPSEPVEVSFDLSDVNIGDSSSIIQRLAVTAFADCDAYEPIADDPDGELDADALPAEVVCGSQVKVPAEFDAATRTLTASVLPAPVLLPGGLDPLADRTIAFEANLALSPFGGGAPAALVGTNPAAAQAAALPAAGGAPIVLAVTSSSVSAGGDFSQVTEPKLSDSQVGLFSGAAETSYPFPVPPAAAGPEPSVVAVYSSQTVDGLVQDENTQPSNVGVGWTLSAGGAIRRGLIDCAGVRDDRCFSSAPDEVYSMSLAGTSSSLVRIDTGGPNDYPKEFRLESDAFFRIRLWSGSQQGVTVTNEDHLSEWWSVETPDGTVYTLGTNLDSADWVPVHDTSANCNDANDLCDRAYVWNVDTVTDAFNNRMTYEYGQERNWYQAGTGTGIKREYIRASRIKTITYGENIGTNPTRPPNARMVIDHEWRCKNSAEFGNCTDSNGNAGALNSFFDVPLDLWCGPDTSNDYPSTCTERAPSFWTAMRWTGVLSQVADGNGGWVTTAHHDPFQQFIQDPNEIEAIDSDLSLVLWRISERPVDAAPTSAGGTYEHYGFNPLEAMDADDSSGVNFTRLRHDLGVEGAVTGVSTGNWIMFRDVWMGDDGAKANEITLRVSSQRTGNVEIWIDPTDPNVPTTGTLIKTIALPTQTPGNDRDFYSINTTMVGQTGVHDVYLRGVATGTTTSTQNFVSFSWIQFGRGGALALPQVARTLYYDDAVGWDWRQNRLNDLPDIPAMSFPRIKTIDNQLGGRVEFTYGQSLPCGPQDLPPTTTYDVNERDCFPVVVDGVFIPFNRWSVVEMNRIGQVSTVPTGPGQEPYAADVRTTYEYEKAGWGFDDNPDNPNDTWSSSRGYNIVRVTDYKDDGSVNVVTEHRFHQGLHQERRLGGATPSVILQRSNGGNRTDHYALRGRPYEVRQVRGAVTGNGYYERTWTSYPAPFSTVTGMNDRKDPKFAAPSVIQDWQQLGAQTLTRFNYLNRWGVTTAVREEGRAGSGFIFDDRTTVTKYYTETTTAGLGDWRGPMPCVTATRAGTSTAAPSATTANGFDRWTMNFYDGQTTNSCSREVDKPVVRRTAVATKSVGTTAPLVSVFDVDNRGRVIITTDPKGQSETVVRDLLHGQTTKTINRKGWESSFDYDEWRRPTSTTDFNGRVVTSTYDEYSRLVSSVAPPDSAASPTIRITYDQDARPAKTTVERKLNGTNYAKSTHFVDGFGRSVLTRSLAPDVGENWAMAMTYDSLGREQRTSTQFAVTGEATETFVDPNWGSVPQFTEVEYDVQSRPFNVRTRKGLSTATGAVGNIWLEKYRYLVFDVRYFDRRNFRTDTRHDGHGRTRHVLEDNAGVNDEDIQTTYFYNSADDLVRVEAPDGEITTMTYDTAGRKKTLLDPDSGSWAYEYDANSNLIEKTEPSGNLVELAYDELDRITERRVEGELRAFWQYDSEGAATEELGKLFQHIQLQPPVNGANVLEAQQRYLYDAATGRTRSEITWARNPANDGNLVFRTNYTYRADGTIHDIAYPSDTNANTSTDKYRYEYNERTGAQERLVTTNNGATEVIVDSMEWNQSGELTERQYGPGGADGVAAFVYDPNTLRLKESRGGTTGNTGLWQRQTYQYDKNANIIKIWDIRNDFQWQCFVYDRLDRVTRAYTDERFDKCNGPTASGQGVYDDTITYDNGGNILSKTGTGAGTHNGTYAYDDPVHAHAVTSTSNGDSFMYDDNGNMEQRIVDGVTQTLAWDLDQRLDSVTDGVTTTEFAYDAEGSRVRRNVGDEYDYYVPSGVEYSLNSTTNDAFFTYYLSIGGQPVAFVADDVKNWLFRDQVGSSSVTRDENGVVRTQRYTPWGELRLDGALATDRHFTGQVSDVSTGLAYYGARYYDPAVGRFVSPDTIVSSGANGQDLNRYSYVRNNPMLYTDSSGNEPEYAQCYGQQGCPAPPAPPVPDPGTESLDVEADVPWYNRALGVVGTCVTGTEGCTEEGLGEIWGINDEILEVSYGITEATTGLGDEFAGSANNFDRNSALATTAEVITDLALLPIEIHPATATGTAIVSATTGSVDTYFECRNGFDQGCFLAGLETTVAVAPLVPSAAVRAADNWAIYAADGVTDFTAADTLFSIAGETVDLFVDYYQYWQ